MIIGFDDESTQRTDLNRCRIWGENKKVVKTNSTEVISVNTMGFYPLNGEPVVFMPEKGNSESFCIFLQKVREANGDKRIVMITDNCRIHKTKEVSLDFRTSGMTCRSSIPFVDYQDDPGTIVLGFYDGSRALAGMGS